MVDHWSDGSDGPIFQASGCDGRCAQGPEYIYTEPNITQWLMSLFLLQEECDEFTEYRLHQQILGTFLSSNFWIHRNLLVLHKTIHLLALDSMFYHKNKDAEKKSPVVQ